MPRPPSIPPHRPRRPRAGDRGVVLLLVLGILALLSLLAVSFVFQSRLELRAAQNFEGTVSADEVALAGAEQAKRLLEVDKLDRELGPDGVADTGDEEAFDGLIDPWRGATSATLRLVYQSPICPPSVANEVNLQPGDLLQVFEPGPPITLKGVGLVLGVDASPDDGTCPPSDDFAEGTITLLTETPSVWAEDDWLLGPGTDNTAFGAPLTVAAHISIATALVATPQTPVQISANAIDLNADATIQASNLVDDDNDGTIDEAGEGFDGVWQNYYDDQGRLAGRYAVLIEDESAKVNVNVIHNFAADPAPAPDLDPRTAAMTNPPAVGNVFAQNAGVSTFEISAREAVGATAADASRLVFYRHGLPHGDNLAPVTPYAAGGDERNRLYVPGQGRSESAGYTNAVNDDDDASRLYHASDGIDNDGDGNVALPCAVDPNCDEADEGINEPQEFRVLIPFDRQPQVPVNPEFAVDGADNDGDAAGPCPDQGCDEPNEGDDQPILALEDIINTDLVNMPELAGVHWLAQEVNTASSGAPQPFTLRRNLVTIYAEDRNLSAGGSVRVNPNFATPEELASAALAPFMRTLPAYTEAEFRTYQAAINLHDYRDSNLIRDEVRDPAGNVFAGVEQVRINEIMVAPSTQLYEPEELGPGGGWAIASVSGANLARAGSPRALPDYLHSGATVFTAQFSNVLSANVPDGTPGPFAFLDDAVATDNDGDGFTDENVPAENDGPGAPGLAEPDGFYDEDPAVDGIDEDGDGSDGEDAPTDLDGVPDGLINEDGSNAGLGDVTAKFVIRLRTNENGLDDAGGNGDLVLGLAPGAVSTIRGLLIFVNGEAIWPAGTAPGAVRWGIPTPLNATTDGQWFVQEGLCRVVPDDVLGPNTVQFLKPRTDGIAPAVPAAAAADRIDIDWFYITFEPDGEWIELVNLGPQAVDVSGWTIQTDAVVDSNLTDGTVATPYTVQVTVPAGTALPAATAAGPSYTVFSVDAIGANTGGANTTGNFTLLDQEANDTNSPDTMAYDKLWPTLTSALPLNPNPNPVAIQLSNVLNLFDPPSPDTGFAADGIDNDGDTTVDEPDEEANDFIPFTELFPNEPINDFNNDASNINARGTATDIRAADGVNNDEDGLTDEDDENTEAADRVWTGIDVATVSLLDAAGNLVDRVTYDAQDIGWATDPVAANAGFGTLERRSPMYAGDRLQMNRSAEVAGAVARVDNFVLDKYDGVDAGPGATNPWVTTAVPVLADGNYDDWTPRANEPVPTPGAVNRSPLSVEVQGVGALTAGVDDTLTLTAGDGLFVPPGSTLVDLADTDPLDRLIVESVATDTLTFTGVVEENHGAAANYVILPVEPFGQLKNQFLATVGELGRVPFDDGHPYDRTGLDSLRLDDDLRGTVTENAGAAMAPAATTLQVTAANAELLDSLMQDRNEPVFLRDHASDTREHMRVIDVDTGTNVLTVVRGEQGPVVQHAANAVFDVLIANPAFRRTATVGYTSSTGVDPAVGNTITNTTQGNSRVVLRVDAVNDRMLVWDDDDNSPWETGDLINNGAAFGLGADRATIRSIHVPEAPDVAGLVDSFSVEALVLEPTVADVTLNFAGWSNSSPAADPDLYTIAIDDEGSTVDMVWDANDGIEPGVYCLYVFGLAGALLQVEVLDSTDTPIAILTRGGPPANDLFAPPVGLSASQGDNITAYGPMSIPYDTTVGNQLRLRFTNVGAEAGATVTQNQVTRVVLAPPVRTPGRINLNTATARVLRGLPNLDLDTEDAGVLGTITIAERIVEDRRINGPFTSIGDLMSSRRGLNNAVVLSADTLNNDGKNNGGGAVTSATPLTAFVDDTVTLGGGHGAVIVAGMRLQDTDPALTELLTVRSVAADDVTFTAIVTETHPLGNTFAVVDEAGEAEAVFEALANLVTVRSDVYKVIVLGQAAVDANGDGIIQDGEVRAQKKLELVYER